MLPPRKIIHIDMDCFYASIEIRDNPQLAGQPVAVGGSAAQRGVLTTCNYEARKFGLHSAMPTAQALKRCPQLVLLPVNMAHYRAVSLQIRQIFARYTDIIEPLSLDEAYLDVSHCTQCSGSATWIARDIRQTIWNELQLTASAGVAPLKFLAKIASDYNKPNGQFVIRPEEVADFVRQLPLSKIPGVGKVTEAKLTQLGLHTCGDIQQSEQQEIYRQFGKFGQRLWAFSHGIDPREVETNRPYKSLSVENTLLRDITHISEAETEIERQYATLLKRLKNHPFLPEDLKKLSVKLKFDDFQQTTLERTTDGLSVENFRMLLAQVWGRCAGRKVRLIGITVHFPPPITAKQLDLW